MELNRTGYFRHARHTLGRLPVRRARNVSGGVTAVDQDRSRDHRVEQPVVGEIRVVETESGTESGLVAVEAGPIDDRPA